MNYHKMLKKLFQLLALLIVPCKLHEVFVRAKNVIGMPLDFLVLIFTFGGVRVKLRRLDFRPADFFYVHSQALDIRNFTLFCLQIN